MHLPSFPWAKTRQHSFTRVAATLALMDEGEPSVEEVLVEFLDVNHLFNPAAYVESDHQPGEKQPVDQYDALAQHVCRFFRRWREGRRRDEQALVCFEPI